jgi:anti-anti-sigma factor
MSILVSKNANVLIVMPVGRLDAYSAPEADERIAEHINEGERYIVVDFAQANYISSAGLRVLINAVKKLKSLGGAFALCNPSSSIQQVLEMSGLSDVIPVFGSLQDAIRAASPGTSSPAP